MIFKEKKEYLIKLGVDNKQYRLICTKITKEIKTLIDKDLNYVSINCIE